MAKEERTITIHAVADNSKPSGYDFWMMEKGVKNPPLEFNKNNDKLKKTQYYTLNFKLDGNENGGLRFSKDPNMVMWAKYVPGPTSPCVDAECHLEEIFLDPATPIQDNSITVINVDRTTNYFAIGFNFLRPGDNDGPGTDYALYDPIGGNQDGGYTMDSPSGGGGTTAAAFIGGALLGAAGTAIAFNAGLLG